MSTDGRASFVSIIVNDGEGLRALEADNLLSIDAGDQERLYLLPRPTLPSLMTLRDSLTSFRIDG